MCWPRSVPSMNMMCTSRFLRVFLNMCFPTVCLSELSPEAPGAPDGNRVLHQHCQHHHTHSDWLWLWDGLPGASDCALSRLYNLKGYVSADLSLWIMCSLLRQVDVNNLKDVSLLIRKASPVLIPDGSKVGLKLLQSRQPGVSCLSACTWRVCRLYWHKWFSVI